MCSCPWSSCTLAEWSLLSRSSNCSNRAVHGRWRHTGLPVTDLTPHALCSQLRETAAHEGQNTAKLLSLCASLRSHRSVCVCVCVCVLVVDYARAPQTNSRIYWGRWAVWGMKPALWTLLGWVRLFLFTIICIYLSVKDKVQLKMRAPARARTPAPPPEAISSLLETCVKPYKRCSHIQILVWITSLELLVKLTCALWGFDCKLSSTCLWERIIRTSHTTLYCLVSEKRSKHKNMNPYSDICGFLKIQHDDSIQESPHLGYTLDIFWLPLWFEQIMIY